MEQILVTIDDTQKAYVKEVTIYFSILPAKK